VVNVRALPTLAGTAACLLCSTAFTPLFEGFWWWFGPVLFASLAATAAAVAARVLRLPIAVAAAVWLCGLACTLTALCARQTTLAGVVPTPTTVSALGSLLAEGRQDIARLAAPVPQRPGLVALAVIGTYVVVVIVDMLVVTLGRPTLAGLPLLGLFAVPAAVLSRGVGTAPFVLGAAGFLLLLIVDGRSSTGRWGRPVSGHRAATSRPGSAALGGRVAVAALAAAVVAPALLPSLDGHGVLGRERDPGGGSGPSTASVVQPIVSLEQQLHAKATVELMTVHTSSAQYLRMTALDLFDGHRFTLREMRVTKDSRISNGLPAPPGNAAATAVEASIVAHQGFQQRLLPLPGTPTAIEGLVGDWRYVGATGTVFTTKTYTSGAHYRVEAQVPNPREEDLRREAVTVPDELRIDTQLPSNLDAGIGALAGEVTAGAATAYDKVIQIQNFLRGDAFVYDINGAPTYQDGALAAFLLRTRRGYCEQFASAMTVMVRALGIPARVAVGFTHGTKQPDGGYLVTNKDAHAWPEVWFPNSGWLRFEPTRRVDAATAAPSYAAPADSETGAADRPVPAPSPTPAGVPEPGPGATPDHSGAQAAAPTAAPTPAAPDAGRGEAGADLLIWSAVAAAALAAGALLALPAVVRRSLRRRRLRAGGPPGGPPRADPAARVHAAWAELVDVATDLGVTIRPSDSPRAGAARLRAYLDAGTDAAAGAARDVVAGDTAGDGGRDGAPAGRDEGCAALLRVARAEERARYAPPEAAPADTAAMAADIMTASAALWSAAPRSRRIGAAVAPRSVLSRVGPLMRAAGRRLPLPSTKVREMV
jgi:transglutaminase-like putative cysteine protease